MCEKLQSGTIILDASKIKRGGAEETMQHSKKTRIETNLAQLLTIESNKVIRLEHMVWAVGLLQSQYLPNLVTDIQAAIRSRARNVLPSPSRPAAAISYVQICPKNQLDSWLTNMLQQAPSNPHVSVTVQDANQVFRGLEHVVVTQNGKHIPVMKEDKDNNFLATSWIQNDGKKPYNVVLDAMQHAFTYPGSPVCLLFDGCSWTPLSLFDHPHQSGSLDGVSSCARIIARARSHFNEEHRFFFRTKHKQNLTQLTRFIKCIASTSWWKREVERFGLLHFFAARNSQEQN